MDIMNDDVIVTNEQGGKHSAIKGLPTEIPPLAMQELACVMGAGSIRYPREADGTPNWHLINCKSNLDHGLLHILKYQAEMNKPQRDPAVLREQLSHAAARLCMALEMYLIETGAD